MIMNKSKDNIRGGGEGEVKIWLENGKDGEVSTHSPPPQAPAGEFQLVSYFSLQLKNRKSI